ncbi:SAM-dependent methyltransferase [Saccharopolyspora rosea]|uniref:SAM-dependent methyltransferase n=1 Tax=Saccharopolyspora rosea TaxID=524884 RepID=A0ABW3FRH6_9PSEU|nr:SAM-dependent methyltransferase [Saccharopolyspora rosea]
MSDQHHPPGVDTTAANPARMYDHALGGVHNFAADREHFARILREDPDARLVVAANRALLRRAVRYCMRQGIDQFLDLGSGIPTVGNVHEAAHQLDPRSRVVYVDNEPVTVAHTRRLLRETDNAAMVDADLRAPESVLRAAETRRLLDPDRPLALLMVAVLHWVTDAEMPGLLHRYTDVLAPGSHLVISHLTDDYRPGLMRRVGRLFEETRAPLVYRSRTEVADLFDGFDLVPPGVVHSADWQAQPYERLPAPERSKTWAAVGRKR